jgi:hypothetical protein
MTSLLPHHMLDTFGKKMLDVDRKVFETRRKALTPWIIEKKKALSFYLGQHMRICFETLDTIGWQVLEMVRIEKGGAQQMIEEWQCYSPLISFMDEQGFFILHATVTVEIHAPQERRDFLRRCKQLPFSLSIHAPSGHTINSKPVFEPLENEEKGSCVNFIRFVFDPQTLRHGIEQEDDWMVRASLDDGTVIETAWPHRGRMNVFSSFNEQDHLLMHL